MTAMLNSTPNRRFPRRVILQSGGAAILAATFPPTTRAASAPLRVGIIPIFDVAPFYAAQQQGYFAAENIAVEPQVVRGGAAGIAALASGSIDVLYTNGTSVVIAIERGIDLRIMLQGVLIGPKPPDVGALVKRRGDASRTGKDLEGKIVAVNALRDEAWMFVQAWIKATGGDPNAVQMIELPMSEMSLALKQKRVDASFLLDPFMTIALSDPALELLDWPMSKVYPDGPGAFYAATPQLTVERPADLRSFVRAYKHGAEWVNENRGKDAVDKLIAEYSGTSIDIVRRVHLQPANAEIIPSALPRLTSLMTETGLLVNPIDLRTKIFS